MSTWSASSLREAIRRDDVNLKETWINQPNLNVGSHFKFLSRAMAAKYLVGAVASDAFAVFSIKLKRMGVLNYLEQRI